MNEKRRLGKNSFSSYPPEKHSAWQAKSGQDPRKGLHHFIPLFLLRPGFVCFAEVGDLEVDLFIVFGFEDGKSEVSAFFFPLYPFKLELAVQGILFGEAGRFGEIAPVKGVQLLPLVEIDRFCHPVAQAVGMEKGLEELLRGGVEGVSEGQFHMESVEWKGMSGKKLTHLG